MAARQCMKHFIYIYIYTYYVYIHQFLKPNLVPNEHFSLLYHLHRSRSFILSLLTSLACHDQMGAFRVQWLTWDLRRPPFHHIPYRPPCILLSLLPSITSPSPYIHFSISKSYPSISLPLGTDTFHIIHHNESTTTHKLIPPRSTRYENWLFERVIVRWKCGHNHEMKTWVIYEKKSILNRWQDEDGHLDFTT